MSWWLSAGGPTCRGPCLSSRYALSESYTPPAMRDSIRSVEAFPISCALPRPVGDGQGLQPLRQSLFVKVTAEDGTYGWGEGGPPVPGAYQLRTVVAPNVVGMNALDTDLVHARAARLTVLRGLLGAVDMAVWDLKGKLLDQPIARMLGGVRRHNVPAYASLHNYSASPDCGEELAALIQDARGRGFRAVKLKIGGRPIAEDVRYLRLARDVAGPDFGLMADANQCYELPQAARVGRILEELGYAWFEEPIRRSDLRGYVQLRAKLDVAIAGGEGAHSPSDVQVLLDERAVDILQPDVATVGGITEARHLPRLAALWGAMPTWHVWSSPLVQMATLHVLANQESWRGLSMGPEAAPLEVTTMPNPMRESLLAGEPGINADGTISLPSGPGLGVDVMPAALKTYALSV